MIVVDAGHGGTDPGAVAGDIVEKEYALKMSNYMVDRFKTLGASVKATRTTDETLTPTVRVQRILNAFGNRPEVVVLSNHLNAGGGKGAEVIYALRNTSTLSRLILEEIAKEGQNIRSWYQRRLPSNPSRDYYFIHRDTGLTEPVLIEPAFIDNAEDAALIKSKWQELSEAVVRAVCIYKKIPYQPPSGQNIYVVKSGDSLYSVAKRFGVSVDDLKAENNLTSNLINVGQYLKIPTVAPTPPSTGTEIYTVKSGDSLWSIAQRFNTTVTELRRINNLTTDLLSIGQVLQIPSTSTGTETYTVRSGDSLWSIAQRFNTTVTELRRINNLTTDVLSIGQVLQIPSTRSDSNRNGEYSDYTVERGDNIWAVANKFNVPVSSIRQTNKLESDILSVGQNLKISK